MKKSNKKSKGFSLIEVLVCVFLVAVALIGLAQLFTYAVLTNARADKIANATFLAQQQIDQLRSFTSDELDILTSVPMDELINVNQDGIIDFRRITRVQRDRSSWLLKVLVFTGSVPGVSAETLLSNPASHGVRADLGTVISR